METSISNFYRYSENIATGGQLTIEQIESLKQSGYEVIVNISPASTKNYLAAEPQLVESRKMNYIHFPIDCSNLNKLHYALFSSILKELKDKKIFIHCGGNIKSSNLMHMYDVLENKKDEAESLITLKKIQNPEAKWFDYFKLFGMKGLS